MTTKELHNLFIDLCEDLDTTTVDAIEEYAQEKANDLYTMDICEIANIIF